jgi:hypothetical protein
MWENYGDVGIDKFIDQLTMGRTVTFPSRFALKAFTNAAEMVLFPDPGVPAKAMRIRRRESGGLRSESPASLSLNVSMMWSMVSVQRDDVRSDWR